MEKPLGRRERNKAATRSALQGAALRLFEERGYDATTVEDIADIADVSARTFFRYFATKDDVLFDAHEPRLAAMRSFLADRPDEPLMRSIEAVLCFLADDLAANAPLVRLQKRMAAENAHVRGTFRQHHQEIAVVIADFVTSRLDLPDPRSIRSRTVAAASMGAFLAAARSWSMNDCIEDLHELVEEALDTLRALLVLEPV